MRTTKPKTTAPRPGRRRIAGTLLAVALLAGACSDVSSPGGTIPAASPA